MLIDVTANRLKQLRHEHNYSQEFVIDHTGLDVGHFEAGISIPTLISLTILCKFYKITLGEFFTPLDYPSKE